MPWLPIASVTSLGDPAEGSGQHAAAMLPTRARTLKAALDVTVPTAFCAVMDLVAAWAQSHSPGRRLGARLEAAARAWPRLRRSELRSGPVPAPAA